MGSDDRQIIRWRYNEARFSISKKLDRVSEPSFILARKRFRNRRT